MILSSRIGMMRFYRKFGCEVWEKEFADLYTTNKADIRANLRNAIDKFEKRLYNVSVTFSSEPSLKARVLGMKVKVNGNYRDGEREEKFESTYLLG